MKPSQLMLASVVSLGLWASWLGTAPAQMPHDTMPTTSQPSTEFQRMEQPLWAKVAVTTLGFGLIGLEIWWFVLSKPKAKAE
jgi:plastocyanin domain-containing protein